MGVDTAKMRREVMTWQGLQNVNGRNMLRSAADELDALRAENAKLREQNDALISAGQKQDVRGHELAMDLRDLARAMVDLCVIHNAGGRPWRCRRCGAMSRAGEFDHTPGCPVALAERVLSEPVTQLCPTTADNAQDVTQDGAHG